MKPGIRIWLWLSPLALYAAFVFWYTDFSGPLTPEEVDYYIGLFSAHDRDPERIVELRRFLEEDSGDDFIMVNLLHLNPSPPELPATGPEADADSLLGHYMEHMYPELLSRASHPVFFGQSVFGALDLAGIEGAEVWTEAALMRYRSRRDLVAIVSNPAFTERHPYKLAALTKTIAFPVEPGLHPADPRLLLLLALLAVTSLLDLALYRR